jgi:hypothetical protein
MTARSKENPTMRDTLQAIKDIPQQPQVQASLQEQLVQMRVAANKLGCYDAADFILGILVAKTEKSKLLNTTKG